MKTNEEIYRDVLGMIDLTSLNSTDTVEVIAKMASKVNDFKNHFPSYSYPASICVFPNFASTLKRTLTAPGVDITVVGGCFPASQSFTEIKVAECLRAVEDGADEVDIVLSLGCFLGGDSEKAGDEIKTISSALRNVRKDIILKVILETGALKEKSLIEEASFLAMESGADFIKTSTGKIQSAATGQAAEIMCRCINSYFKRTGRRVGFKPAGGIVTAQDALLYYTIVSDILGEDWLNKRYFRFGASRMANNLLSALEGSEVKYY